MRKLEKGHREWKEDVNKNSSKINALIYELKLGHK
jgi:hypothetical protein